MKKKPKKAVKAKPKVKPQSIGNMIGTCVTWNGNVYTVITFDTLHDVNGRFEKVELTAVRHLPIEV
jgi:hypothetical protein